MDLLIESHTEELQWSDLWTNSIIIYTRLCTHPEIIGFYIVSYVRNVLIHGYAILNYHSITKDRCRPNTSSIHSISQVTTVFPDL